MKEINKPQSIIEAEESLMRDYATQEMQKVRIEAQKFLKLYGILSDLKDFDPTDKEASEVFAGAIMFASDVFANRLVLGHNDFRKEGKLVILKALKSIIEILQK